MKNMAEQEEMQKALMELQVLNEQVKVLESEAKRMSMAILELTTAYTTLENLKEGEAIIPIGGSTFLFGEVKNKEVLLPIGAGYYTSLTPTKAREKIKRRIEKMDEAVKKLEEERQKLMARVYELAKQLRGVANVRLSEKENK